MRSNFPSEAVNNSSPMSEAALLLRRITNSLDRNTKARIGAAARRLGWGYSRTREVWYQNARRIDAQEMDCLRREAARAEIESGVFNLLELRSALTAFDPQFHSAALASLDDALRALGGDVGSVELRQD